ncbi:MAG: Mur ligase family protein, partial [Spirochaetota bacterium]|nr:Mur ligase family protein [Spirochaetota bacterium]
MNDYIEDKKLIYADQTENDFLICNYDDEYGKIFAKESSAKALFVSGKALPPNTDGAFILDYKGYVRIYGLEEQVLPKDIRIPGEHNRLNLLYAALILRLSGIDVMEINKGLKEFTGIAHRMELITTYNNVKWYNDSASTIPQATAAALRGAGKPVRLIAGGTDKKLDFDGTVDAFALAKAIYLLKGSATDRLTVLLENKNIPYSGPYNNLQSAVEAVEKASKPGEMVIFSPGATSFGMFNNEFDRGDQFRQMVLDL